MDDNQFDDSIKQKVGSYEATDFDPAALASLHHQLAYSMELPWYARYRTELFAASGVVLVTLILLLSQWYWGTRKTTLQEDETFLTQQQEINKLRNELNYLKTIPPDTIRIIEIQDKNSALSYSLLQRVTSLQAAIEKMAQERQVMLQSEREEPYIVASTNETDASAQIFEKYLFSSRVTPHLKYRESTRALKIGHSKSFSSAKQLLSVNTIREMEKHYQKGVGIRMGPTVEFSKGFYSEGEALNLSGGLLGDFILSPALSLETGLKYVNRYYEINKPEELQSAQLPDVDETLGLLIKAEMDYKLIEIPFTLKYRYPLSRKAHWLYGMGYSTNLYFKQIFEYDYEVETMSRFSLGSVSEKNTLQIYPGTANLSIGLSKELKDKKIVESSIYYQYGLGRSGIEKVKHSFLGARVVYWFKVR